jgi:hypothetical protein
MTAPAKGWKLKRTSIAGRQQPPTLLARADEAIEQARIWPSHLLYLLTTPYGPFGHEQIRANVRSWRERPEGASIHRRTPCDYYRALN